MNLIIFTLSCFVALVSAQLGPVPLIPIGASPLVPSPGPYIPNFAPRFAPALFNPFLNPAVNPAIPGIFNTAITGSMLTGGGLFGGGIGDRGIGTLWGRKKRTVEPMVNKTLCSYTNTKSILSCRGDKMNFECVVKPKLEILGLRSVKISNLTLVPEITENDSTIFKMVHLDQDLVPGNWTWVNPKTQKKILVSIFSSEENVSRPGLLVENKECWSKFESLMQDVAPENMRFSFILTKPTKTIE
jgi:hypothetical protein